MPIRRAFITKLLLISTLNSVISAPAYAQDSHPHTASHHHGDDFHCVGCGINYGGHYTSFTGADFDKMMARLQSDPFSALEIFLNTANAKYAKEGNGLSKFRLAIDYGPTIAFGNPSAMKMTVDPEGFLTMHLAFPEAAKTNPYVLLDSIIHFQVFYNLMELTTYKTVEIYGHKAHPSHHSGPLIDTHYIEMSIQSKMGIPKEVIQHNHDATFYDVSGGLSPLETMELVANAKGGSALAVRRVAELEARNFQILKKGTTTFVPIKNLSDADRIVQLREYGALKGVQLTETRSSDAALKELQDKVDLANKKRQDILNAEAKAAYQKQTLEYKANATARELIVQGTALSEMVKANDRKGVASAMEKMLPWAFLEPSEKIFWAGFVESVRNPNYENSTILFRGIDGKEKAQLVLDANSRVTGLGLFSKRLTSGSGSHFFKLKGLPETFETFGVNGTKRVSPLTAPHSLTKMMLNHAGNPQGSPFISLTYSLDTAFSFGQGEMVQINNLSEQNKAVKAYLATNNSGGVATIRMDRRRLMINSISSFTTELEVLASMFVFPDEIVYFEKGIRYTIDTEANDKTKEPWQHKRIEVSIEREDYYKRAREAVLQKTGIDLPIDFMSYARSGSQEFVNGIRTLGNILNRASVYKTRTCEQIFGK